MKSSKYIISVLFSVLIFTSCSNVTEETHSNNTKVEKVFEEVELGTEGIEPLVSAYLEMSNALASDDSHATVEAGESILSELENIDISFVSENQLGYFLEVVDFIKEVTEYIIEDVDYIDFQREHFEDLSLDFIDLINHIGINHKIYQIHCPMAFNDDGADWLSLTQEVKNPYFGDEMLQCGVVTHEIEFNK